MTTIADASQFPHPAAFFNDAMAEIGGQAVYVTEMGSRTMIRDAAGFLVPPDSAQAWSVPATSRVYRVSLSGQISEVISPSRKVLVMNGVAYGNFFNLLVAEFFYGNVVKVWPGGIKQIIATGFRGADGIEQGNSR